MISVGKRPSGHVYSLHILLKINELLNLGDGFLFGRKNPTAPDEIDGLCTNIKGCPEGHSSFGSGFPIGASSIPVGTRFSVRKSLIYFKGNEIYWEIKAVPRKNHGCQTCCRIGIG